MTQAEIISIIPDKFIKELIDRKIYNRVIEIMMQQIETLDELNRIKTNITNIQDFPIFMTRAFHWKSTREKYTGWFKIVFNKDFYEKRKTAGSASEDHIAGRALSLGDIYHTNTARTFDKCAKESKDNTINGVAENRKE